MCPGDLRTWERSPPGARPAGASRILDGVSSSLSNIPVDRRRRAAATVGLFATLFLAMGLVALTGSTPTAVTAFSAVALTLAAFLGLVAWGLVTSVRADLAEQRLDRAIEDVVAASGVDTCGCGHDHDPDELHVTGDPCDHDGSGRDAGLGCSQTCDTCVLAMMRPSPDASRAERLAADRTAHAE